MNCNIFKKRLEDYVLGNISNDLKIALEKHMEECESCRRLYEEEVEIDRIFESVLSIDGIEFNSSRTSIMNSIDKNRYSKKTSNKILFNFKKYKNQYLSYAVATVAVVVFIPMMLRGFVGGNYKSETSQKNTAMYKLSDESNSKIKADSDNLINGASDKNNIIMDNTQEKTLENATNKQSESEGKSTLLELKSSIATKQDLPNYEIVWKNSSDGRTSAAIDVTVQRDVDFGIHQVYVKNIKTNEIVKYEVINNERQYTPMIIEWWDKEHLIIVAGLGYGTIEHGSEVYSLDVNTGILTNLYMRKEKKYQILDMKKVSNDLIFELLIYDDDTYNAHHSGVGKITLLDLDNPVDMQIVSEEKK